MLRKWLLLAISTLSLSAMGNNINPTFIAEVTATGAKITAIALEYEDNILSGSDLRQLFEINTSFNQENTIARNILRAYVNDKPQISHRSKAGKFIIIEMDDRDKNANFYDLKVENDHKISFKTKNEKGEIVNTEKVQANRIPQFYEEKLQYHIAQTGQLTLTNGKSLAPQHIIQPTQKENIHIKYIEDFSSHKIHLSNAENSIQYKLYKPQQTDQLKRHPLTIFLHGSGQVGNDNLAHLLSSKGAISTLQYEEGFVIAPQYHSVFDPFDQVGIHWQTNNRHQLIFKIIDDVIRNNPSIDTNRIYIVGLSRGAEGGLYLLQKRPHFFAAALLMSGREANTVEWIDGNATVESLSQLKDIPIWFFHSAEDKISPVKGSRINYSILKDKLQSKSVKYTEFNMNQAGDHGIINNNPHNTWDAVFNSPEIMYWLLTQHLSQSK